MRGARSARAGDKAAQNECVMLDMANGPTVLLPRNVARAAASADFADFVRGHDPEVARTEETLSGAREFHELSDRVIRMRAGRSRRTGRRAPKQRGRYRSSRRRSSQSSSACVSSMSAAAAFSAISSGDAPPVSAYPSSGCASAHASAT